jgi:hypothetical protein
MKCASETAAIRASDGTSSGSVYVRSIVSRAEETAVVFLDGAAHRGIRAQLSMDAGAWELGAGLNLATTAASVDSREHDEVRLTDGPYAEGKEHIRRANAGGASWATTIAARRAAWLSELEGVEQGRSS